MVAAGALTIFIIALRLTKEQQGYYFTFGSLLALQVFFELGLMQVLATFTSHEFANLAWEKNGLIVGDPIALERLKGILGKSSRWFAVASILLIVGLIPAGLIFFGREHSSTTDFVWRLPWILAVLGTAANLFTTPFWAIILGSGDVVTVNHRELIGTIAGTSIALLVLWLHGGLYAIFAVSCGKIVISWVYLIRNKRKLLKVAWLEIFKAHRRSAEAGISWWGEIWPMQWRIAISWVAGYFVFQLFTPVLFQYQGAVVAGQMGMTLNLSNALLITCLSLIAAKAPEFAKLIAGRNWAVLDALFKRVLVQSLFLVTAGAFAAWGFLWFLQDNFEIGARFIPSRYAALLFATVCLQIVISSFAVYLRAHKQEPFMILSILVALLQGPATLILGKHFSILGVTLGFFCINLLFTLPSAWLIWMRCRREWHTSFNNRSFE